MEWRNYDIKLDKDLDLWISPKFSEFSELINKYAFFNETISSQYKWYQDHPKEIGNIETYFKVVEISNLKIGLVILNYSYFQDKYVIGINPLAINPRYINKGYGTIILNDLIHRLNEIINKPVDQIDAGIDLSNIASIKLFTNLGVKQYGASDDNLFLYCKKIINF